jgi:MFS family permease
VTGRRTPPRPTSPRSSRILALAEFRALLGARLTQSLGASALATVVAFQTYEVTGNPLALGLLGLVEAIPALALMLIGGHLADRRDRRGIVIVASSALAFGAVALAVASLTPTLLGLPLILAVAFLVGVASGFERPALSALEAQVIPIEHASTGTSWISSTWLVGSILGPVLGGIAVAVLGLATTYVMIALLLAGSTACVALIARRPIPEPELDQSVVGSLASGVRYVAGNEVLLGSMALDLFAVFFGGAIAMLPVFATDILMVGPLGLGVLRTAPAAGALLATLATARFQPRQRAGPIFLSCVTIFGVSMVAFGLSSVFVVSLAALFVSGFADGVSMVIRGIILRVESPEAMRGRIASVNYVFIGGSNELGAFESGVAASAFGVVPSVVGGGLVTLGVVAVVAIFSPHLRTLDLARRMVDGPGASGRPGVAAEPVADQLANATAEVEQLAT